MAQCLHTQRVGSIDQLTAITKFTKQDNPLASVQLFTHNLPMTLKRNSTISIFALFASLTTITHSAPKSEWTEMIDQDLSQWELWMGVPHTSVEGLPEGTPQSDDYNTGTPLGLNNDPKNVFSVIEENDELVLKITGEIYGGLTTLKEYSDFHLSAEVKFGDKKWAPRLNQKRDNGILYHCTGPHGAFWNVWMRCIECQVQETDIGDLYTLAGTEADSRALKETNPITGKTRTAWDPSQELQARGGFKRSENFENPHGEWTTVEVYTVGTKAIHVVNGHVVLAIENMRLKEDGTPLSKGLIQIQSEGAETYYRNLKIRPLKTFPPKLAKDAAF